MPSDIIAKWPQVEAIEFSVSGAVLADGAPADIARNEQVKDVYFGRQGAVHGAH